MLILTDMRGKLIGYTFRSYDNLKMEAIHEADYQGLNICTLIPSFIDYLYPIDNPNYIATGDSREFENYVFFSPETF